VNAATIPNLAVNREQLIHALYEAAELEHNLMCTYLYAAFSLRQGEAEGLRADEVAAVEAWRQSIMGVAIEEMAHLAMVWNITVALGAAPRFGRMNFPLDPGYLPAGIVVKLAPFNASTLQHFIFLERTRDSNEPEGEGFVSERPFVRGNPAARLTPMGMDYDTVGEFYEALKQGLLRLVEQVGESEAFRGDPDLQLVGAELGLPEIKPVRCLNTALHAFDVIVSQGEGAPADGERSHFRRFMAIREEFARLRAANSMFSPAFPAATNPVLRRPPRPEGRVWLESPDTVATVDLANASYGLMLRLLAHAYALPASAKATKSQLVGFGIDLMHVITLLGEHAARLPAGPSHPECHAGVSFTTLRDSAAFPPGRAALAFFVDRVSELSRSATALAASGAERTQRAAARLSALVQQTQASLASLAPQSPATPAAGQAPKAAAHDEIEVVRGEDIEIQFQAKRCIHSRFCVTGAPKVFLANVKGPWIHPDAMPVERLAEVAHACPSGAIRYRRLDGQPNESAAPVNLASIREAGPYALRGDLRLNGESVGYRVTLCRCGASKNKPFCDGSHHEIGFSATGEPATVSTEPLAQRDGELAVTPAKNGPLQVRGNLEIVSGTGRIVARVTSTALCRCGGSNTKPFCDGTHARIGFRS
jgi:CDGSH-type Zn-finger protein/uncharacterized Fe-S cluster protein YjdI